MKFYMIACLLFAVMATPAALDPDLASSLRQLVTMAPDVCQAGCPQCARTDATDANTCDGMGRPNVGVAYTDLGGSDGCCFSAEPACSSLPCKWIGNLNIKNVDITNLSITIYGPGTNRSCPTVPPGGFCTKSFDNGPTNPAIVAGCPSDNKPVPFLVVGPVHNCGGNHTFYCGTCPTGSGD